MKIKQNLYLWKLTSNLQRFYKKAAAFVLRAVAKHSPQLAQSVVDCGALDALVICLEEFDPGVKEAAAWALGYIARHNGGIQAYIVTTQQWHTLRSNVFKLSLVFFHL